MQCRFPRPPNVAAGQDPLDWPYTLDSSPHHTAPIPFLRHTKSRHPTMPRPPPPLPQIEDTFSANTSENSTTMTMILLMSMMSLCAGGEDAHL